MYSAPPFQQAPQVPRPQLPYEAAGRAYGAPQQQPPQQQPPQQPQRRPGGAMLVVDQTNQRFDLRTGSNVIGRGSDSDLQLLDQGISRRHLDIQYDGHYATAYDLGSTNGTTVNGHEISSHVLRHGDVVRIGHTRIVFHQDPPPNNRDRP
jgi:pSer/pThr/pTyr-binding forkhead associated (FHA) protein